MNASTTLLKRIDTKVLLSTLWIVVMINMLKADILSLYIPGSMEETLKTAAEAGTSVSMLMLFGAFMMELSILMIILSRVLNYRLNRKANILISAITIVFVIAGGVSYPHYIFIASVEVICLLLILWSAWNWRDVEAEK